MAHRIVQIVCDTPNCDVIEKVIADQANIIDSWQSIAGEKRSAFQLLIDTSHLQQVIDDMSVALHHLPGAHLIVQNLEAIYPEPQSVNQEEHLTFFGGLTREELYDRVETGANLNLNFLTLLVLSTLVAAIGLHVGDLAVVIGAMVIAPLLQPHIAFSMGAALGDLPLMRKAAYVNLISLVLVLGISCAIGYLWPAEESWNEVILARTKVDYSNIILALAAGAAAVLSLTTGTSSALVGVMVAVALLPPMTAVGLFLGSGESDYAIGAAWLAVVNIICINIASKFIFWLKKIRAVSPEGKKASRQALILSYGVWLLLLSLAVYIIATQNIAAQPKEKARIVSYENHD